MSFSPFARYRNYTVPNLKDLLMVYPDMQASFSWSEAGDIIEAQKKGYKKTAYQQACQFGLEDRSGDRFRIHSYLFAFDDEKLNQYLQFWMKTYYAPNPYVNSDDDPMLIYCELAHAVLESSTNSICYEDFFSAYIGGKSEDILLNAIDAFCAPLRCKEGTQAGTHIIYVASSDVEKLKAEVDFIESDFPLPRNDSRKVFFDRFSHENFCHFFGIPTTVEEGSEEPRTEETQNRLAGGENRLYYGVPGAGKSYRIDEECVGVGECFKERVVFHPDYSYADFVGQILPTIRKLDNGDEKLDYSFVPGPFTLLLKKAENNPTKKCCLIIEELNRGNAPAIFGDLFQLLDRTIYGESRYGITNVDISKELVKGIEGKEYDPDKKVKIPSNMWIYATMNTSDQNVFTLDTAFQRRWHMTLVRNEVSKADHAGTFIANTSVTWGAFASVINDIIVDPSNGLASSEDKRLGAYFVSADELSAETFAEKVLKYLWDDAFKMNRDVFAKAMRAFDDVVEAFTAPGDSDPFSLVFREDVYQKFLAASTASSDTPENNGDEQ